jgi:hypothetical protein
VREVARLAQLEGDVDGFPLGFETPLGERGVTLSGGQRQRTAIARAIIRDPSVLIFDDALSAVDTQTEAHILAGLRRVQQGRTTIVVAHRVSAFQHCDRVLVFDEGRLVESGTPDELLAGWAVCRHRASATAEQDLVRRQRASSERPGGGMTPPLRRPLADPTVGGMVDPDYDVERRRPSTARRAAHPPRHARGGHPRRGRREDGRPPSTAASPAACSPTSFPTAAQMFGAIALLLAYSAIVPAFPRLIALAVDRYIVAGLAPYDALTIDERYAGLIGIVAVYLGLRL